MRKIIAKTTINYMEKENKEVIKESTKKKEKQPEIQKEKHNSHTACHNCHTAKWGFHQLWQKQSAKR